jgi:para-aminobenzoate synthetase component 1
LVFQLPYHCDTAELFDPVADRPWSMWLDSGAGPSAHARYDLLVINPVATLLTRGPVTEVETESGTRSSREDPFELIRKLLKAYAPSPPRRQGPDLPFSGGAVGYFGYDLGRRLESLPAKSVDSDRVPDVAVGIYREAVIVDHRRGCSYLAGPGASEAKARWWGELLHTRAQATDSFKPVGPLRSSLSRAQYREAFDRIQQYIRAGDCYQVNFAQRFSVPVAGDPWAGYRELRRANPAPFSAFLNLPDLRVMSFSPERFVRVHDGVVETRPIKGTRPRHADPERDKRLARDLRESAKDRAENLMIVDLLRNDLGKVCAPGSVAVPELFALESFASVHHLVSTVTGNLADGRDSLDLLRACFPGGSITGAPKIRAMEIIDELERYRRGVYCGAIGYVGFDGRMDSNIAIRTATVSRGTLRYWAGGGIVADSNADAEYQESLDKAAGFFRAFGLGAQLDALS